MEELPLLLVSARRYQDSLRHIVPDAQATLYYYINGLLRSTGDRIVFVNVVQLRLIVDFEA